MRRMVFTAVVIAAIVLSTAEGLANWPQWRGPELNGVSKEAGLPRTWSPTENIA